MHVVRTKHTMNPAHDDPVRCSTRRSEIQATNTSALKRFVNLSALTPVNLSSTLFLADREKHGFVVYVGRKCTMTVMN